MLQHNGQQYLRYVRKKKWVKCIYNLIEYKILYLMRKATILQENEAYSIDKISIQLYNA